MKLVAGLGNPGQEYVYTRHNMGWSAVDHIVRQRALGNPVLKFGGEFWRDRDLILLKPLTYMNLSGTSVRQVFDFYKIELPDVLIVYDDTALPFGQLRLRGRGSAGGHNGLASVIACLGTLDVPRLRIGIGVPPGRTDTKRNWVLGHLSGGEIKQLPDILDNASAGVEAWMTLDLERAMSRVNVKTKTADGTAEKHQDARNA